MTSLANHTAAGQALGYFFQLERALSWLSVSPAGSIIGVETEDDVVVQLLNGEKIFEQDKSSTTSNFPFDGRKKDFWNTLLIWLDALKNKEIQDKESPIFYMVTNKIASKEQLVHKISAAKSKEEALKIVQELRSKAKDVPSGIQNLVQKVTSYSDNQLTYLFQKIVFIDGSISIDQSKIISDLQLPEEDSEYYMTHLIGYIFKTVVENWRDKRPGRIYRDDFIRLKNQLIKDHFTDFFNEESIRIADIAAEAEVEKSNSNQYIKQLQIIETEDEEIYEAIEDFLRSSKARTEMARKGYVWEQAFVNMHDDLKIRWKRILNQKKNLQNSNNWSDIELGKEILYSTLEHKANINGYPTRNYFLTSGTYHLLANKLIVGWHPNYKKILKDQKNGKDT